MVGQNNTPGSGIEYEVFVPAHFALVLNNDKDVEDFSIRSNVAKDFGNLDDVVVEVKMENGRQHRFAFQLKHKENNNKNLSPGNFAASGNFSLEKYCNAFKNMKDEHKKYLFILYTNANFDGERRGEVSNFDMVRCDLCLGSGFFNTSVSGGDVYRFEVNQNTQDGRSVTKEDYSQFFPRFFLYTCQKNFKKLKEDIVKILGFEEVFLKYVELFRKWHQGEFTNKTLDKKTLNMHLIDFYSSSSLVSGHHLSNDQNKHLRLFESAVRHFDVTVIDDAAEAFKEELIDSEISAFLDNFPPSLIEKQLEEHTRSCKMDFVQEFNDNPKETMEKCLLRLAKEHKFVERCAITLDANTKLKMLHYLFEKPLIFDFNETSKSQIYKMMELHRQSAGSKIKFVLLGHGVDVKKFSHLRVFENLNDLAAVNDGLYRIVTKTSSLSLQGRKTISLEKLIDCYEEIIQFTTPRELYKMLKGKCLIGEEKEPLPSHYVPRSISVTLVDLKSALDHCIATKDIAIINFNGAYDRHENMLERYRPKIKEIQHCLQETQLPESVSVISTNEECSCGRFEKIRQKVGNRNLHYFKHLIDGNLMLAMSSQSSFEFENVISANGLLDEKYIHAVFNAPITILCDRPGMGKSTLSKVLKNECEPDWWPLRVDLKAHNTFLKEKRDHVQLLTHFLELDRCEDRFLRNLKSVFLARRRILILLDGLDEIENVCVENVLEYATEASSMGYRVWLTSRQNLRQNLKERFNILPIEISELTQAQQKSYIHNRLRHKYGESEIEEIVAKIFTDVDIANNLEILGVPLQLHILTQIFSADRKYQNSDESIFVLTKMYKLFFEGRYRYSIEKLESKNPHLTVAELEDQLEKYEIAAVQSLFDDQILERLGLDLRRNRRFLDKIQAEKDPLGIVVAVNAENRAVFEHQTYAEYFASVFFAHNFDKAAILADHIFPDQYQNFWQIFNIMLSEESHLHLAIIYKDVDHIEKCLQDGSTLDKGGRNALHLASIRGTKHPIVTYNRVDNCDVISDLDSYFIRGETSTGQRIIECLLQSSYADPFVEDHLFKWNPLEYALASGSLYYADAILEKHGYPANLNKILTKYYDDVNIAFYSLKFGYRKLLAAVLAKESFNLSSTVCWSSSLFHHSIVHLSVLPECAKKTEIIALLLEDNRKQTFLQRLVRLLSRRGKEETTPKRFSLLHYASKVGNAAIIDHLLTRGLDVNVKTDSGESPLHFAAEEQHVEAAALLLDRRASVNCKNEDKETPLHYAAGTGNVELINLLLEKGANLRAVDYFERSVLGWAARRGRFDAVNFLIERGAPYDQTLLHDAASGGNIRLIEMVLDKGFDVDSRDKMGSTPLFNAVFNGRLAAIDFLIAKGADIGARTKNGDTILHHLTKKYLGDKKTMNFLLSKAEVFHLLYISNNAGLNPLHMAVYKRAIQMVEIMLIKGIDLDRIEVKHPKYPLEFAVKDGRIQVDLLLQLTRDKGNEDTIFA